MIKQTAKKYKKREKASFKMVERLITKKSNCDRVAERSSIVVAEVSLSLAITFALTKSSFRRSAVGVFSLGWIDTILESRFHYLTFKLTV